MKRFNENALAIRKTNNIYPLTRQKYSFQCFRTEMQGDVEGGENWNVSSTYTKTNRTEARSAPSPHKTLWMTSNEQRYLLLQFESAKTNLEKGLTAFEIDTNVSRHYPSSIYFPSSSSLSPNAPSERSFIKQHNGECNITFRHYFHCLFVPNIHYSRLLY